MIVVKLQGGLGNQMFQYALGRAVSLRKKTELFLDIFSFKEDKLRKYTLDVFSVEQKFATKQDTYRFRKFKRKTGFIGKFYNILFARSDKYFNEKIFHFDPEIFDVSNDCYIDGYWNTEKYFKDIRPTILKDFSNKAPISGKNKEISESIASKNSVSVHIRRGDYANDSVTRTTHGLLDKDYYYKAFDYIKNNVSNPALFVFSDDIPWVKDNLALPFPDTYIDWNADKPQEDMRLMSLCKHHIIANSTFSWWGAWLSQNPNKIVIGPKKWFNQVKPNVHTRDVMPESWIKI